MLTPENLNSFLALGYFLDYKENKFLPLFQVDTKIYKRFNLIELTEIGSKILLEVFSEHFKQNSKHLVPLSGGYDSRAIIGGLLKFTDSSNIKTFTYGVPGSYDFEIGKNISKMYGLDHIAINFQSQHFTMDMLLDAAKRFRRQTMLFFHPDYRHLEEMFADYNYWSGFLGGEAAGAHFPKWEEKEMDIDFIKRRFLKNNSYVRSVYLSNEPLENLTTLLNSDYTNIDNLTRYEKIDFFNRQTKYIAPHVCPDGFKIITPFSSSTWLNFICSIPRDYRRDLILYKKILLYTFPELFMLPTKNRFGLSLGASEFAFLIKRIEHKLLYYSGFKKTVQTKKVNYFDINDFIRNNKSMKEIIIESLRKLKGRNLVPWIDLDLLLNKHLFYKANYGDALQVLASLEIILSSKER